MKQFLTPYFLLFFLGISQLSVAIQDIENPKIKWQFKTEGSVRSTAVILNDAIYFGSSDGYLYALNKENGALIWKHKTDGAIVSTPEISNNSLYISSRDLNLYSINIKDGSLNWKFKMGKNLHDDHGGWKYFMASPKVEENNVLIGSGDGHLYAIDILSGKLNWKFKTNGRIRATPLVHQNKIYQPSNDGYVYVLDLNGKLDWKLATTGTTYNPNDYTFDRSSIIAQPLIKNNILVIASRDGNTYGIDLKTHKKIWNFNYGNTWAMSTNISDNTVYVGWSTNDKFCALDLKTGEEKWQFKTGSHNFPTALLSNTSAYITSSDGKFYRLNKLTGEKVWDYTIGDEIYSSPVYDADTKGVFFGCDNGFFYAVDEGEKVHKIVFLPYSDTGKPKGPRVINKEIIPYLSKKGFKHIDDENILYQFIQDRIDDKEPSVIVFTYLVIPHNVLGIHPEKGLMRQYLEAGGKIIWPGDIPNFYERNELGKKILNKIPASKLLDVEFHAPETGCYFSKTTQEGLNLGFPKWIKTYSVSVSPKGIIPLAYNEFNQVSLWMKKFHPRTGSGYISSRTWGANTQIKETDLDLLYKIAVYGLE